MNTSIIPNPKACHNCGEQILFGRTDKKFCTDACRVDYNNKVKIQKRVQHPQFVKNISRILVDNYSILRRLYTGERTVVKQKQLTELGFNYHYITSDYRTKKGDVYRFCFDHGYLKIDDDKVLLVVQANQVQM